MRDRCDTDPARTEAHRSLQPSVSGHAQSPPAFRPPKRLACLLPPGARRHRGLRAWRCRRRPHKLWRMVSNSECQRAEQGLREALDRLEHCIDSPGTGDPLIPFAEALNWIYSLEEWHRKKLEALGVNYYARRDGDPDGEILAGVIYARGLVAHHLASVGILADLDRYYDDYGAYGDWVWRPFSDLPPPNWPEKHGRDDKYKRHVQHKRLRKTMRAGERFFASTVKSYYP
jgi:hypothetical protein